MLHMYTLSDLYHSITKGKQYADSRSLLHLKTVTL